MINFLLINFLDNYLATNYKIISIKMSERSFCCWRELLILFLCYFRWLSVLMAVLFYLF